jgi:hypothetical protein
MSLLVQALLYSSLIRMGLDFYWNLDIYLLLISAYVSSCLAKMSMIKNRKIIGRVKASVLINFEFRI